jgi:hypothetical protein
MIGHLRWYRMNGLLKWYGFRLLGCSEGKLGDVVKVFVLDISSSSVPRRLKILATRYLGRPLAEIL